MALTQISTAGVKDDAVTSGKIPANAVGSSELADNAVDTAAIANSAVTSAKIANASIDAFKLAANAVDADGLQSNAVTTAKIADQAVDLTKLPHGTSSNDGKFLRANNGADPTFETVNTNLVADTSPQLGGDLASNGNNILMADTDEIRLGTGGDLQIYHDGSNSYIDENGTGNLRIRNVNGNGIELISGTGELNLKANYNGSVDLYHDNSKKLETTSTGATVTGTIVADNAIGRNMIINGDMRIAQRGTSGSYASSGASKVLACDRWRLSSNGSEGTVAQVAEVPDGSGFKYSLKTTVTNPTGSLSAGNYLAFIYAVERNDIMRLAYGTSSAKTATLSFWFRGSLAGKLGVKCSRNSRVFSTNTDITANTWKFVEVVIPADTSTALSGNDIDNGFDINITADAGSNYTSGGTGGWIGTHVAYTAGFTNGQGGAYLTTDNSNFQITGVQLEIGSKSTAFEHKPISEELDNCRRYYQNVILPGGSGLGGTVYQGSGGAVYYPIIFSPPFRTDPTVVSSSGSSDFRTRHGDLVNFAGFSGFNTVEENGGTLIGVGSGNKTVGHFYWAEANSGSALLALDAEF